MLLTGLEGDLGLLAHRAGDTEPTLLIVEREGSEPGNERNILKWHAALCDDVPIELRHGQTVHMVMPRQALLLLAFGSSAGWRGTPYTRTLAYCALLAGIVNAASLKSGDALRVHVVDSGQEVTDWQACGEQIGRELAGLLIGQAPTPPPSPA